MTPGSAPTAMRALTGTKTASASTTIGAEFIVWDGYITGKNLELERPKRIVQSWRTAKFMARDPDSKIEVTLVPVQGGTTIRHTEVPDDHTSYRDGGWQRSYFEPMKAYFSKR